VVVVVMVVFLEPAISVLTVLEIRLFWLRGSSLVAERKWKRALACFYAPANHLDPVIHSFIHPPPTHPSIHSFSETLGMKEDAGLEGRCWP
jgi:hypothetical protein